MILRCTSKHLVVDPQNGDKISVQFQAKDNSASHHTTVTPEAAEQFVVGAEYEITFTKK